MSRKTHLLLDFDHIWVALAAVQGWRRLECYLACQPEVHLTFVTRLPLEEAMAGFSEKGDLFPNSWITGNGTSLHRLQADGTYEEDHAFELGLELLHREELGFGAQEEITPALAALYLGAKGWTPRPRIVVADPTWNDQLLGIADRAIRLDAGSRNIGTAVLTEIRAALEPRSFRTTASPSERAGFRIPPSAMPHHAPERRIP